MYSQVYRGFLNNVRINTRRRRIYKENSLYLESINKVEKKEKKKPINFNNGDHLGDQFHFLLKKEYQLRKNSKDLPPFLL